MDLIKVISEIDPSQLANFDFWTILVAIFGEKANKRQLQAAVEEECIILALKTPEVFSPNYSGVIWSIDAWQNSPGWVPVLLSRKIGGWSVEFCKQKQQGGNCAAVSEHGQCIGSKKELL